MLLTGGRKNGRQMQRDVDAVTRGCQLIEVRNVAFGDLDARKLEHVAVIDVRQIEDRDPVAPLDEGRYHGGAQPSGATCDQNLHATTSFCEGHDVVMMAGYVVTYSKLCQ